MISFHRPTFEDRPLLEEYLTGIPTRGCEYSFANMFMWGAQQVAFLDGCAAFFSHFDGSSVYPYPIGPGDRRRALEQIMDDANQRGIPCRLTCLSAPDIQELESWFPGQFYYVPNRDSFDYVYDIDALADLKGKALQKKRNHVNRFQTLHPDCGLLPLNEETIPLARNMAEQWFQSRTEQDPNSDFFMERIALSRAFRYYDRLNLEGLILTEGEEVLAFTIGSRLSADTFDIHFEKALDRDDGAYAFINRAFARFLREQHPDIRFLNREDDMGLPGLRKAKLSYQPHHLVGKSMAILKKDCHPEECGHGNL